MALDRNILAALTLLSTLAGCQRFDEKQQALIKTAQIAVASHFKRPSVKLNVDYAVVGPQAGERRACGQTDSGEKWLYIEAPGHEAIVETTEDTNWSRDIMLCANQQALKARDELDKGNAS